MKHIKPFPYPNTPEHLMDRSALLTKIMTGVLVQPKSDPPPENSWDQEWFHFPCWLHAAKWEDGKGYKKMRYKGGIFYIHRTICELVNGPIPEGHLVDHLCRVHGCCQPRHLEAVPTKVNTLRGDNPNWMMRQAEASRLPTIAEMEAEGDRCGCKQDSAYCPVHTPRLPDAIGADDTIVEYKTAPWPARYEVAGKLGDVPVTLETPRPEFWRNMHARDWSTPDLVQVHIDHGHPRFRPPLDHQLGGLDFLGANDCMDPDAVSRHIVEHNLPDVVARLPDGTIFIPYTEAEQEALRRVALPTSPWYAEFVASFLDRSRSLIASLWRRP